MSLQQNPAGAAHLVGAVRHGEGELVGVLLLFAAVNVLDAAGRQVGLRESADSGACRWRERERGRRERGRGGKRERQRRVSRPSFLHPSVFLSFAASNEQIN